MHGGPSLPPGLAPVLIGFAAVVVAAWLYMYHSIAVISGAVLATGITLLATGLNEYVRYLDSTTELGCPDRGCLELETSSTGYVFRVSMRVKNLGATTVRDAAATLTLNNGEELEGIIADDQGNTCKVCPLKDTCGKWGHLTTVRRPLVRGEPLVWAPPETPPPNERPPSSGPEAIVFQAQSPTLAQGQKYQPPPSDYQQTMLIAPQLEGKLVLFDFRPCGGDDGCSFVISFTSNYGAPLAGEKTSPVPRPYTACLKFGRGKGNLEQLEVEVAVYGESLRRPYRKRLKVTLDGLERIYNYLKDGKTLEAQDELQKFLVDS